MLESTPNKTNMVTWRLSIRHTCPDHSSRSLNVSIPSTDRTRPAQHSYRVTRGHGAPRTYTRTNSSSLGPNPGPCGPDNDFGDADKRAYKRARRRRRWHRRHACRRACRRLRRAPQRACKCLRARAERPQAVSRAQDGADGARVRGPVSAAHLQSRHGGGPIATPQEGNDGGTAPTQ